VELRSVQERKASKEGLLSFWQFKLIKNCFSRRRGDIYNNGIVMKVKTLYQVVGLAKENHINLYRGHR
jgi:hypothetical protein